MITFAHDFKSLISMMIELTIFKSNEVPQERKDNNMEIKFSMLEHGLLYCIIRSVNECESRFYCLEKFIRVYSTSFFMQMGIWASGKTTKTMERGATETGTEFSLTTGMFKLGKSPEPVNSSATPLSKLVWL